MSLPVGLPFSNGQYKIFSYQWRDHCAGLLLGQPNADIVSVVDTGILQDSATVWNLTFVGNRAAWQFNLVNADPSAEGGAYASVDDDATVGAVVHGSPSKTLWTLRAGPQGAYQIEATISSAGGKFLPELVWSLDTEEVLTPIKLAKFTTITDPQQAWVFEKQTSTGGSAARGLGDLD